MKRKILITLLCLSTASCAIRKDLETPFSTPTNKPVINNGGDGGNGTKDCLAGADGKFDGVTINMTTGMNADGSAWAEGGGCILKPIREAWASLNNLEAMKWEAADSFTYERTINPTTDFTHLYTVTYAKSTLIGEINWTIQWFQGFDKGTFLDPERVNIVYGRTSGTSNIPIWNGRITLTKISDTVTAIEIHNNFKARQSNSDNISSSQDCLRQITAHSRNGNPDWTRLNTGFKDNPSKADPPPPDDPAGGAKFCVKDAAGNYPTAIETDSESDQGVSVVTVRQCVPMGAAALYQVVKNPVSVLWKNATTGTATASPSSPDTQIVAYSGSQGFLRSTVQWTQDWTYAAKAATDTMPENYLIHYKMDPATNDFPVWQGTISITSVADGEAAIQIQNLLLLDSVSGSPAQNKTLSEGVLTSLTSAAAH